MTTVKRPSFQFYPGDWMTDVGLRMCSVGARGLWADMLCLMHQGSTYGYLEVNLTPILPANLANLSGASVTDCVTWLDELRKNGVFSEDARGCIFSRRMLKDEKVRAARAAGGSLGGNPQLINKPETPSEVTGKVGNKVNLIANLRPTPSSSSSSSINTPLPPKGEPLGFTEFWKAYPNKANKQAALKAWAKVPPILHGQILAALEAQKKSQAWLKDGGQFIPHASTWINGNRWEDDLLGAASDESNSRRRV
jgi:hypothetical protein